MVQKIRAVKLPGFCLHSAGMAKRTKAATGFVQLYKPQKIPQIGAFSLDNTPNWCIMSNVIKRGTAQEDIKMAKTFWSVTYRTWGSDFTRTAWFDSKAAADEFAAHD